MNFDIIILALIGIIAGILSGLFGIGGGIIVVPSLVFFMEMSQHKAQGTSIALMLLPIGILAAYNYYKEGEIDMKAGIIVALFFILGGYFGSKISLKIDDEILKKIFGIILLVISLKLIFQSK